MVFLKKFEKLYMKKKIAIIIEAPSSSKRLPGKILLPLGKKTVLEFLIQRLKILSKKINSKIIIATTTNKDDRKIVDLAKKNSVNFYQGSENNVLKRVVEAAKKYKTEVVIRITSDCPLIDVNIVKQIFETFKNNNVDLVTNAHVRSYPDGMDVAVMSTSSLKKALLLAKRNRELLEHVTLTMKKYNKKFKIINYISPEETNYPKIGLTLDEINDYKLIKNIVTFFKKKNQKNFTCIDLVNLIKKNKNFSKINQKVKRTKYSV